MMNLSPTEIPKFIYYLALLYNMLGLSYINRESYHEGMGCLAKAYQLYEDFLKLKTENVYHNRSEKSNGRAFRCFYEGGINHEQM